MAFTYNNRKPKRIRLIWKEKGIDTYIKKFNVNSGTVKNVWSSGSTVTYYVDSSTRYTEEVDSGASVLSPTTFKPEKDGWRFIGWRKDTTANDKVLTSEVMDSEPITLYAVYQQETSCIFISGLSKANSEKVNGMRYYNAAGNTKNASIKAPDGMNIDGWDWRGWTGHNDTIADTPVSYYNGDDVPDVSSTETHYGLYEQTVTVNYYWVSNSTKKTSTGKKYHNSYGNTKNPEFTISPSGYGSEWTFRGWTTDTAANASVTYSEIKNTEIASNVTLYILLQRPVTLSYNGNGATGGIVSPQTDYVYLNSYGTNTISNPSFTLATNGFSRTNYEFTGWDLGAPGATITLDGNRTAYAQWKVLAVPYIINSGWNTRSWTVDNDNVDHHGCWLYDQSVVLKAVNHGNGGVSGITISTTLNTQKCNRMKIRYKSTGISSNAIMGTSAPNVDDGYITVPVSGDTVDLVLQCYVPGLYSSANEGDESMLYVYSVEFYYE